MCAYMLVCVHLPFCGGYDSTSLACLVMWLMAEPPDFNLVRVRALVLVLQANGRDTSCMHNMQMREWCMCQDQVFGFRSLLFSVALLPSRVAFLA